MKRPLSSRLHGLKNAGAAKIKSALLSSSSPKKFHAIASDASADPTRTISANTITTEIETKEPHSPAAESLHEPSSDFWDRAEEYLLNSPDPGMRDVMVTYLSILESATESKLAARGTLTRQIQLSDFTAKRIQTIDEKKWTVNIGKNETVVDGVLTGIAKNILAAKELISTAASADPHIALACAGVSLIITV